MSIEAINRGYSPETVYGNLTSPFIPKSVSINSHTAEEEISSETRSFSLNDFVKQDKTKMRVSIEKENTESLKYPPEKEDSIEFPPKLKVGNDSIKSFVASSGKSKDIVQGALKKGYSTEEAIVIARAKEAYSKSASITKNPIGSLNKSPYRVH